MSYEEFTELYGSRIHQNVYSTMVVPDYHEAPEEMREYVNALIDSGRVEIWTIQYIDQLLAEKEELERYNSSLEESIREAKASEECMQGRLEEAQIKLNHTAVAMYQAGEQRAEQELRANALRQEIIRLKAKLYDLMTAEEEAS